MLPPSPASEPGLVWGLGFWREHPWTSCTAHPGQAVPETSLCITSGEDEVARGLGFPGVKLGPLVLSPLHSQVR